MLACCPVDYEDSVVAHCMCKVLLPTKRGQQTRHEILAECNNQLLRVNRLTVAASNWSRSKLNFEAGPHEAIDGS